MKWNVIKYDMFMTCKDERMQKDFEESTAENKDFSNVSIADYEKQVVLFLIYFF